MSKKIGYLVDLASLQFNEGGKSSWIQLMPLGNYEHPLYGELSFTEERIQRFADNANAKVRGTDLDIDYDHKMLTTKAAGWIKEVEARPDGLWGLIDWTPDAAKAIKNKEYRYFSPEFLDEWTHPKTKVTHKDVLNGGGITNRPFLKDILPLNLSEYLAGHEHNEGSRTVDPEKLKALAEQLGLPADATVEQVMEAAQAKLTASSGNDGGGEKPQQKKDEEQQPVVEAKAATELLEGLKKLAESNTAVKQLMDIVNAQGAQLAEQSKELTEARLDKTLIQLSEKAEAKKFSLPAVSKDAIRKLLSEPGMSRQLSDKIVATLDKVIEAGLVELGERGQSRQDHSEIDGVKRFTDEVQKVMNDRKVDYATAANAVAAEQPQLFAEYQAASYAGRE